MRNKINILTVGTEVKRVGYSGRINVPKILAGRYLRISLLQTEEEIDIIKKVQNSIEYKKEREKSDKKLAIHYKKLNNMRKNGR